MMATFEFRISSLQVRPTELQVHEKVGQGQTAQVFRGTLQGTEVAVKEFKLSCKQMSKREQLNLGREVEIMQELNHPLLVNLVGIMMTGTMLRLVTDFCCGGHLFDLLHNNDEIDLAPQTQVQVLHDIADAMAFLHSFTPKVIHRDLKSVNVLLVEPVVSELDRIRVKVCDFGRARKADAEPSTMRVGTQHWMAPEVFMGQHYDHRADVFSFGMVMFEVCCREMPFEDLSESAVALTVATGGRPDMDAIPPDCPAMLVLLMMQCWSQAPDERPEFTAVIAELDRLWAMF